jgi:hypothetical protein
MAMPRLECSLVALYMPAQQKDTPTDELTISWCDIVMAVSLNICMGNTT